MESAATVAAVAGIAGFGSLLENDHGDAVLGEMNSR
jgi:hypothetical protein